MKRICFALLLLVMFPPWQEAAEEGGLLFFWKIEPFLKERGLWVAQGWVKPSSAGFALQRRSFWGIIATLLRKRGQLKSAQIP
jgi:hypothetical protein